HTRSKRDWSSDVCSSDLNRGKSEASIVGEIGAAAEFYDYDDKYKNGVAQLYIPARLDPEVAEEIRRTAVRAYNLLGCDGLARVEIGRAPCRERGRSSEGG